MFVWVFHIQPFLSYDPRDVWTRAIRISILSPADRRTKYFMNDGVW